MTPFPYAKKAAEAKAAIRARIAEAKAKLGTPVGPSRALVDPLLAETVIQGATVKEWSDRVDVLSEDADDRRKETGKFQVLDMVKLFPAEVIQAVDTWRAAGRKTEYDATAAEVKALQAQADKLVEYAAMDDANAKELDEMGRAKKGKVLGAEKAKEKADKLREAADRKREKADALLTLAEEIIWNWKKLHPGK